MFPHKTVKSSCIALTFKRSQYTDVSVEIKGSDNEIEVSLVALLYIILAISKHVPKLLFVLLQNVIIFNDFLIF